MSISREIDASRARSMMYQNSEEAKAKREESQRRWADYRFFINNIAQDLHRDFDLRTKQLILNEINQYLIATGNTSIKKFFRSAGRDRAEKLKTILDSATCTALEFFNALDEVVYVRSDNQDSLINFVFRAINQLYDNAVAVESNKVGLISPQQNLINIISAVRRMQPKQLLDEPISFEL